MADLLRKGFLLGVGAALAGKEKLDAKLKELVAKGEITPQQAKDLIQRFVDKGEAKSNEWNEKNQENMQKKVNDLGLATKADVDALKQRISHLELRLQNSED
ncbi:phasin family protein [Terribacillus saccharophilus]|uniref:phasin family protein n=1 Tax=Terribacillus saccharophilus TaxID=361277 RepID=UPI0039824280